ncbi:MAG: hypothetical protein OER56_01700 [Hyphomicrobiales bacterium]|nr:hypothetical protein [Hyphomicrobiales bacterium]
MTDTLRDKVAQRMKVNFYAGGTWDTMADAAIDLCMEEALLSLGLRISQRTSALSRQGRGEQMYDEGWWTPRASYGDAVYSRRCPHCAAFVKPDKSIKIMWMTETPADEPNATCKKHGRIKMPFLCWSWE